VTAQEQALAQALGHTECFRVDVSIDLPSVTVSRMYDYVEDALTTLVVFFPGMQVREVSRDSEAGCETCDHGSRYSIEFEVTP
jgi:hypothetical protein